MSVIDWPRDQADMRDGAATQQVNHEATDLTALRAQLRAATLRPEADASGEMLADLSVAQAALARPAGSRPRAPTNAPVRWSTECSSSSRSTARRARRS